MDLFEARNKARSLGATVEGRVVVKRPYNRPMSVHVHFFNPRLYEVGYYTPALEFFHEFTPARQWAEEFFLQLETNEL